MTIPEVKESKESQNGQPLVTKEPETALEFIEHVHALLQKSPSVSKTQRLGRALMQLLMTGSFHGSDLFVQHNNEECAPAADLSQHLPTWAKHTRHSFEIGNIKATSAQILFYLQCLASLVKRGFQLDDGVPAHCTALLSLISMPETSTELDKITECDRIARQFKQLSNLTTTQTHSFLMLWSFCILSLRLTRLPTMDLVGMKSHIVSPSQFVERAL